MLLAARHLPRRALPALLSTLPSSGGPRLPVEADTVVVGGGIVGVCTAYHLAR
jgi:hypothetical protein